MDTLHAGSNGNINPVIDQQRHIVSLSDFVQFLSCCDLHCSVAGLVSILDNRYSWMGSVSGEYKDAEDGLWMLTSLNGFFYNSADITTLENGRGRVCDQVYG